MYFIFLFLFFLNYKQLCLQKDDISESHIWILIDGRESEIMYVLVGLMYYSFKMQIKKAYWVYEIHVQLNQWDAFDSNNMRSRQLLDMEMLKVIWSERL